MAFITWEQRYCVGLIVIDEQHKILVDLINKLFEACISSDDTADEVFKKVIKECVEYVKVHFSMEEGLMNEYEYPDIVNHKKEHSQFIIKILDQAVSYEKKSRVEASNFTRFLRDWLLGHIALTDRQLGAYLNSKGVL